MKRNLLLLLGILFIITTATAFMIRLVPVPKKDAAALAEEHFALRNDALQALDLRRYDEAEKLLRRVRSLWPRDMVANRLFIRLYYETDRLDAARKQLLKMMQEAPGDALLWNASGCISLAEKSFDRAEADLKKAARLKSDSAGILLNLAALQQARGLLKEARQYRNAAALLVLANASSDSGDLILADRLKRLPAAKQASPAPVGTASERLSL